MSLRPYKFQIIPVCQVFEDGQVVEERMLGQAEGQPLVVFGIEGLREFADSFEERLVAVEAAKNGKT